MIPKVILAGVFLFGPFITGIAQKTDHKLLPDALWKANITFVGERGTTTLERLGHDRVIVFLIEEWCGPCRAQADFFNKNYADWQEKGVQIIGLSVEISPKEKDALKKLILKKGYKFKIGWTDVLATKAVFEMTRVSVIPHTLLLRGNSRLDGVFYGASRRDNDAITEIVTKRWLD
jgi:thiol-disulfide isomerase/thioredoxin